MHLLHMHENARSVDGREMSLMTVISQTLKFIADKALEKLKEQVTQYSLCFSYLITSGW